MTQINPCDLWLFLFEGDHVIVCSADVVEQTLELFVVSNRKQDRVLTAKEEVAFVAERRLIV